MNSLRIGLCLALLTMAHSSANAGPAFNKITYRLEKSSNSGFTTPEQATSSLCVIKANGSIQTQLTTGGLSTSKRDLVTIKGDWADLIATAIVGTINTAQYPVDANSISYRIVPDKVPPNVKAQQIILFEQNGGTGSESVNGSPAAITLRNFMDLNCGNSPQSML